MKKILSVLCVLAFVASFACIGVSADATPSFALVAEPITEGATTVTVKLQGTLPEGTEVAQAGFTVEYDEALTLTEAKNVYAGAMFIGGQTTDVKPYPVLWILGTSSLPVGTSDMVEFTFALPEGAAAGDTYEVTLTIDTENAPANINGDVTYADAPVANAALEVVAETTVAETTTEATETETEAPVASESESKAPVASESEAPAATTTEAPATTKAPSAAQTGDMMFVVVAVMVVALGADVVVKKVNVK